MHKYFFISVDKGGCIMWKKIRYAVAVCILCMLCVSTVAAEDAAPTAVRMEKPEYIELVLVLDKSGSMAGLESDTIGGFNAMIEKQKELAIPVRVTAVLFNDEMDVLYAHKDIRYVRPLTAKEYEVGGTTALLDAVGNTILRVEREPAVTREGTKVIFVIITDGMENGFCEHSILMVERLEAMKMPKEKYL